MDLSEIEGYARGGSAPHQLYLSRLHMMGSGVQKDVDQAMEWLAMAIRQGSGAAYCERAVVLAQGYAGTLDTAQAWQDMLEATERGDVGATRQLGVFANIIGDQESALGLWQAVAEQNDIPGTLLLADALLAAGDRDAGYWFARAGGNTLAQWRMEQRGLATSTDLQTARRAVPSDILDTLDAFNPFDAELAAETNCYTDPLIFTKSGVIDHALCDYVMAAGSASIRTSDVVDPDTGESKIDPYRTGFLHQFVPGMCDFTIAVFDHRMAFHSNTAPQQGEPLTMIVYKPGQQYKPHWDHLVDTMSEEFGRLGRSGNRKYTALAILDDGFTGGETRFNRIGFNVRLRKGDMIVFQNLHEDGSRHDDSMHAGLPVETGMKWLASKWIREKDYAH